MKKQVNKVYCSVSFYEKYKEVVKQNPFRKIEILKKEYELLQQKYEKAWAEYQAAQDTIDKDWENYHKLINEELKPLASNMYDYLAILTILD